MDSFPENSEEVPCNQNQRLADDGRNLVDESVVSSTVVEAAFEQHAKPLENFLIGILRNGSEAQDALQATFVKLIEKGQTINQPAALKSWLFSVAYNEALLIKRKSTIAKRHLEQIKWNIQSPINASEQPSAALLNDERRHDVRQALDRLSDAQREVISKRIYTGLKFREIADELNLPLGTVLARMHAGLKKLKKTLEDEI